jgi:hypothetical protein
MKILSIVEGRRSGSSLLASARASAPAWIEAV